MKGHRASLILSAVMGLLMAGPALKPEGVVVFEKLKGLEGDWRGQRDGGGPATVSYRVTSGGSVVIETLAPAEHGPMVTVYHMDQNDLRLTHYCLVGNQPRMRATSVSSNGGVVLFDFVDATNLAKPTDGHMHSLELAFVDRDHIRQKWTWLEDGNRQDHVFDLARVDSVAPKQAAPAK